MKRLASLVSIVLISGSVLAVGSPPAAATFPGTNGDIGYLTGRGARAVQSDGTGDHSLTSGGRFGIWDMNYSADGASIVFPKFSRHGSRIVQQDLATGDRTVILRRTELPHQIIWAVAISPDGASIAFCAEYHASHLYTVNTDGSGLTQLPSTRGYCYPDWSVDDRLVATKGIFPEDGPRTVTTMDPDGSNQQVIATLPAARQAWNTVFILIPSWAPDASAVAFTAQRFRIDPDIWSVNVDGSGLHKLTNTQGVYEAGPVYSPDGSSVVYGVLNGLFKSDLWLMGSDGSNATQITDTKRPEYPRSWQAISGLGVPTLRVNHPKGSGRGSRAWSMLPAGLPGVYFRTP